MSASSTRAAIFTPARSIPVSACRSGCRWNRARSRRRQNHRAAFAEADAPIAFFRAKAAEDDLVAVFDKTALLAARQIERLAGARRELLAGARPRFLRAPPCARP